MAFDIRIIDPILLLRVLLLNEVVMVASITSYYREM